MWDVVLHELLCWLLRQLLPRETLLGLMPRFIKVTWEVTGNLFMSDTSSAHQNKHKLHNDNNWSTGVPFKAF